MRTIVRVTVFSVLLAAIGCTGGDREAERITIALMGDTMLGRGVSREIPEREPAEFWGTTLPILDECDLRILNLETTITTADTKWSGWDQKYSFKAIPQAIDVLKAAGIDYVTLANNHILDFSDAGMEDTIRYLDEAGIRHTGAGSSLEEAIAPATFTLGRLSIGIFSFADHYPAWDAAKRGAGTFIVTIPPPPDQWRRIEEIIERLDRRHDLVILSTHWGPNKKVAPSREVVRFAHRLIDAGVDVIHGHSAHAFQGVEIYRGKVILYDTGDFIDDYAPDRKVSNYYSFLYLLTLEDGRIERLELIPVRIKNRRVRLATEEDRPTIFGEFEQRTARFDTPYEIGEDRITIPVHGPRNAAAGLR